MIGVGAVTTHEEVIVIEHRVSSSDRERWRAVEPCAEVARELALEDHDVRVFPLPEVGERLVRRRTVRMVTYASAA
jgi:hypothetical protein